MSTVDKFSSSHGVAAMALPATSAGSCKDKTMKYAILRSLNLDRPMRIALSFIVIILAIGTVYTLITQGTATLLAPSYLLQQLQTGAFLGIVAAGMMLVILLGHIDLSVPWTLTTAAMLATALGGSWAIPLGLLLGALIGLINGLGVAFLRLPSMIFTLAINAVLQGLMVAMTGGSAPQSAATDLMRTLGAGKWLGIPLALLMWIAISALVTVLLKKSTYGRALYAIGNRETAAYLAGLPTRRVIVLSFMTCGALAALAGMLLAGYSAKAYQGMGDLYAMPAIAAVVIGGTSILGGKGKYMGTVIGVLVVVFLNSVLSIMQMSEAIRQIVYGVVILSMLFVYGKKA